ncbi:uncharacterized protein METZ01_LOCUS489653 [marine metagenome]|uniref:Uncharacterized protein n=1 Tax=marine metagenome TaxID=408172 RepID=A0A383CXQ9_9ZZZZ
MHHNSEASTVLLLAADVFSQLGTKPLRVYGMGIRMKMVVLLNLKLRNYSQL